MEREIALHARDSRMPDVKSPDGVLSSHMSRDLSHNHALLNRNCHVVSHFLPSGASTECLSFYCV